MPRLIAAQPFEPIARPSQIAKRIGRLKLSDAYGRRFLNAEETPEAGREVP